MGRKKWLRNEERVDYDYIFCNPASLLNIVGFETFYNGGKFGIDMIEEVIEFASAKLKNKGHLYILITSILPVSLILNLIKEKELEYKTINSIKLPFRKHYKNIKSWVDKIKQDYPEAYYLIEDNTLFEEVILDLFGN